MKIITLPHPTLRLTAAPVTVVDKKIKTFVADLQQTLAKKTNPRGVGLAATQLDVKWRIFATQLPDETKRVFINPQIVDHSSRQTFGPSRDDTTLEGCLSIPGIYGPVPRWQKITLRYDEIVDDRLQERVSEFSEFEARIIQHERDHLDGILFIDYSAEYDLELYREDPRTKKLIEMDREMIAALIQAQKGV